MDIKTILVHVDESQEAADRIAFAAQLANLHGAHLIGMAQTGILRFMREATLPGVELGDLTPLFGEMRESAERCASQFDTVARRMSVASFEHRIDDEDPAMALALQALYADLVIVGHAAASSSGHGAGAGIPEYVAMNSPAPVLVLPNGRPYTPSFTRAVLAWNASPEAARAVRQALPLLAGAAEVEVVLFDEESSSARSPAGDVDLARFLSRHGVHAEVRRHHVKGEVGNALLVLAEDRRADLLVMGCYGHSRYREILLGGVSRTVLRRLPLPVLLAH